MKYISSILVVAMCILNVSCTSYGEKVEYDGAEVYYTKNVSQETADAVGVYLVESGFADGSTKSIQISKDSIYSFRMVTQEQYHEDTSMDINFQALGFLLSKEVFGGKAINFEICDNTFKTARSIYIEGAGAETE